MVDVLSLLRDDLVNHLCPNLGLEEVGGPHVPNPEHHHHLTISLRDHSVSGKSQLRTAQVIITRLVSYLENTTVFRRFLGRASLAKTMPAMQAWMMTPTTLWMHCMMIASGHSSVVWRDP